MKLESMELEETTNMTTPHRLIIIQSDGKIIETGTKAKPKLSELQSVVGGYVEVYRNISYEKHFCQMIANEDGRSMNLPINPVATQIFNDSYWMKKQIAIVGDVCILMGWRF
jgi:hypothetical protein